MLKRKLLITSLVALSVLSYTKAIIADEDSTSTGEARETAQSVVNSFCDAYTKHDPKAISMLFVPNGVFLPPNGSPVVKGRDAIERYWSQLFKNLGGRQTITIRDAVPVGGDVIVAVDEYQIVGDESNGSKVLNGRAVITLAKTAEGWRYVSIGPQLQPPPSH
jgi:uncharacterized protein (TIGR02246 family)